MARPIRSIIFCLWLLSSSLWARPVVVVQSQLSDAELRDPMRVLQEVLTALPESVAVLPTENYCYWQLHGAGKCLWGNLRLASGLREQGRISFAYSEHPRQADRGQIAGAVRPGAAEGVTVECPDAFTCAVAYAGRRVVFHLHKIPQLSPRGFALRNGEHFVARTFDESGLPFFLIYHRPLRAFFWVLNEEQPVDETFTANGEASCGGRTGFVFYKDGDRRVLVSVSRASRDANDYFDGPFDQLADNYADQTNLRAFLEEGYPQFRGRIDKWGYLQSRSDGRRVAVGTCQAHDSVAEAVAFIRAARASGDPLRYFVTHSS